jgi:hypothetical protein
LYWHNFKRLFVRTDRRTQKKTVVIYKQNVYIL